MHIAGGDYNEPIALTRSGTPTAPITFVGTPYTEDPAGRGTVLGEYGGLSNVVALTGVHDVVVRHLFGRSGREAVLVTDSSRVTIDDLVVYSSGWDSTVGTGYPSARITGASSDVTLSRNDISASHAGGVQVDAGVRHAVLTTNYLSSNSGVGVRITDAPDAVVTGNTVQASCGPLVELAGASTGATVENNVLDGDENGHPSWGACASTGHEDLSVSVGSTAGTKADYNLVTTLTRTPYSWAGRTYATVAQFQQASGQGAHDLSASREDLSRPDSPAVDSADATAPGTLTTDGRGRPRADNPVVANTGTGVGYYDRGAVEAQDPLAVSLSVSSTPCGRAAADRRDQRPGRFALVPRDRHAGLRRRQRAGRPGHLPGAARLRPGDLHRHADRDRRPGPDEDHVRPGHGRRSRPGPARPRAVALQHGRPGGAGRRHRDGQPVAGGHPELRLR